MAVVCFAYYYKPLLCGLGAHRLGLHFLCDTWIRGISTNHWIEIVVYCPLMWFGLHSMKGMVFAAEPADPVAARRWRRRSTTADFAIALVLYGFGLHVANVIEIQSRQQAGISDGRVYELTYFLDEGLSHYVILVALFFVLGWFVVHDPPGRTHLAWLAPLIGVGFGIERAIGLTEAGKWFLVIPVLGWFAVALWIRLIHHGSSWATARTDFLFRFALAFCVTLPIGLAWYRIAFGSFRPPSRLSSSESASLVLGVSALTLAGVAMVLGARHVSSARRSASVDAHARSEASAS